MSHQNIGEAEGGEEVHIHDHASEAATRVICIAIDNSPEGQYALNWTLDHVVATTGAKDLLVLLSELQLYST